MSAYKLNSVRILVWINVLNFLNNGFENAPIQQGPKGNVFSIRVNFEKKY